MRIFVVGTPKSGLLTFYHACLHLEGYSSGFYSEWGRVPHYTFPENHIEVSASLAIAIPRLLRKYPEAMWVHVLRNKRKTVTSLSESRKSILNNYADQWFQIKMSEKVSRKSVAEHLYTTTNDLCTHLIPQDKRFIFHLERYQYDWKCLWERLNLKGSYQDSLEVFNNRRML